MNQTFFLHQTNNQLSLTDPSGNTLPITSLLQDNANVYALRAPMGTGKTTLVRQLCHELHSTDTVNSPTFAIVNQYSTPSQLTIYHIDCYRLQNLQDAINIGIEDYLYSSALTLIEWPDIIMPLLPDNTVFIDISTMPDGCRKICLHN